ncbi:hypothetical protein N665_0007s0014 [Sinapis alba]|nr:hypothetical protein N665_0007s0014 [Sinapis alba]
MSHPSTCRFFVLLETRYQTRVIQQENDSHCRLKLHRRETQNCSSFSFIPPLKTTSNASTKKALILQTMIPIEQLLCCSLHSPLQVSSSSEKERTAIFGELATEYLFTAPLRIDGFEQARSYPNQT